MDVFLMIRRHKTTVFLDAKESTSVLELKRLLTGIVKRSPEDIRLYKDGGEIILEDNKSLCDHGFTAALARAQSPAEIGMSLRAGDDFEPLEIADLSVPPELPDVMKHQENTSVQHETAAT